VQETDQLSDLPKSTESDLNSDNVTFDVSTSELNNVTEVTTEGEDSHVGFA